MASTQRRKKPVTLVFFRSFCSFFSFNFSIYVFSSHHFNLSSNKYTLTSKLIIIFPFAVENLLHTMGHFEIILDVVHYKKYLNFT